MGGKKRTEEELKRHAEQEKTRRQRKKEEKEKKLAEQRAKQRHRQANHVARKKAREKAAATMTPNNNNGSGDEPPTPVQTTERSRASQLGSVADRPRSVADRSQRSVATHRTPGRAATIQGRTPIRMTPQQISQIMRSREERAGRLLERTARENMDGTRAVIQDLNDEEDALLAAAFGDQDMDSSELLHNTASTTSDHSNPHEQAYCSKEGTLPELHQPPMEWSGAFAQMDPKKPCPECTTPNDMDATICVSCKASF